MSESPRPQLFSSAAAERRPWIGIVLSGIWLVFLIDAFRVGWSVRDTARGVIGLLALVAFCVLYIVAFVTARSRRMRLEPTPHPRQGIAIVGGLLAVSAVACWGIGQAGTSTFVFVAVCGVLWFSTRIAIGIAVGLLLANEILVRVVTGWEEEPSLTFAIATATFAMWGVTQLLNRNVELVKAREENARLAVDDERNRFARDLHDILGHSLTVITVKAELASRLIDTDTERARAELADLERLSRDALADVRRAVGGYRELSLSAELVRAREALSTAEIEASLPNSTDDVPGTLQELFAWTVREGVTNVIRHSGATSCTVSIDARSVLVEDDGQGPDESRGSGHGLTGLRERAAAAGAVLLTGPVQPRGFRLEVTLP